MNARKQIYFLGALTLFITAVFSQGYYHFDEHFQILEFAAIKLNMNTADNMPWEYFYKMRPALQPAIVYVLYKLISLFTLPNPFYLAAFLRLLSAAISFVVIIYFIRTFQDEIRSEKLKKYFLLLSFFLWFAVYNEVRFSSENWSGIFFLLAICFACKAEGRSRKFFFGIGLTLGIAFLFRYQTGFLIIGLFAWQLLIKRENFFSLIILSAGILLIICAGAVIDRWFYGEWTSTIWNYFEQNILLNKAANFGVEPWWYYGSQIFLNGIPPFSLIYVAATILFFVYHRKHILTFVLVPFLFIHFIIGHKELRFIFPLVYYLPFMMVMTAGFFKEKFSQFFLNKQLVAFSVSLFGVTNLVMLLVVMFRPADNQISLYQNLYERYPTPTTLYFDSENPYHRILDIKFYKRADLKIEKVETVENILAKTGEKTLFVTNRTDTNPSNPKWKLVYSGLPQWMKAFDFNHWQSRTKFWKVYQLTE